MRSPRGWRAANRALLRAQESGDLADLLRGQVLRVLVHDLIGARIRREGVELALEIAAVLAGEARDRPGALGLLAVTRGAGWNVAGGNALGEDLLSRRHLGRIAGRAVDRRLRRIVGREAIDGRIGQACRHAPHVSVRVRVGAGLVAEGLELGDEVFVLLSGETRKGRGEGAFAAHAVAGGAYVLRPGDAR